MAQAAAQGKQQQYTPEQIEQIKKKLASMKPEEIQEMIKKQCVFCRILAGEIPTYPIWEDKKVFATLEIQPGNPGHLLVVPKKHYSVLPQMPDDEVGYLFAVAKQLAGVVFEVTGAEGVEIRQRNGAAAGQIIPHVHIHIIPRFEKDGIPTNWEPQKLSEADFKKMQELISAKAKSVKITTPKPKVVEKIVEKPIPQPSPEKMGKTSQTSGKSAGSTASKPAKLKKKRVPKLKRHP